ncbi:MAG: MerR family transcriptional regulator [Clostridiaceae bacterium]|jgi:DNA-binding transcriptional MerR regulator|nr:MerR family transcriptional regulator [Clostridiaceae bacterium]
MTYTIQKLARLAGISTRTLRHYDAIGLLCPARDDSSGYRHYGPDDVDRLQQILFYRALDMPLEGIRAVLDAPDFAAADALRAHQAALQAKKQQVALLLATVEKTIAMKEGRLKMTDEEKFAGLKKKLIDDNETRFGREVRDRYGDDAVDASNARLQGMTQAQYQASQQAGEELNAVLKRACQAGDPDSALAREACAKHKVWLGYFWKTITPQAHLGLVEMYVADERFSAYYEQIAPGCAVFLRDAMKRYYSKT